MINAIGSAIRFNEEPLSEDLISEAVPLFTKHWIEVGRKDLVFRPQFDIYPSLYARGMAKAFTARLNGLLVGYAIFFVRHHQHYGNDSWAIADLIYLTKEARKGWAGYKFLKFCDERLALDGARVVTMSVNENRDFGGLLIRLGYAPTETVYTRRTR